MHMIVLPVAQVLSVIAPKHFTIAVFDWILRVASYLTTVNRIVFVWVNKLGHKDQVWIFHLPLNYIETFINVFLCQHRSSPSL